MKKAAIIHGTKGSPEGNWFRWLAAELESIGYMTYIPQFPTPEGQSLENWSKHFEAVVGELDIHSLLIGHSVGAVFALRLLERIKSPIGAAVLVSGFTGAIGFPEYDALNATFIADPYRWDRIRKNAAHIICLSGSDDPYVPLEQGKNIADSLGVNHLVINGGGHLNAESGFTTFPRLLKEVADLEFKVD